MFRKQLSMLALAAGASHHGLALAQATATDSQEPKVAETIQVIGQRLDAARNSLSPDTGSTVYRIDRAVIEAMPMGDATPLNHVILQSPGVVQDSYGQLHVRGDHANLQYRVNGVVIAEAIAGFGQSFDTRFADQINILLGALPAQYGYRTAGVVEIRTKGGALENGGRLGYRGGSHPHQEGSLDLHGSKDAFSYCPPGSYLQNDLGIENPTSERNAIHDHTKQSKGFGYFSYVLGADSRVSLIVGSADNKFQIPNVPGQDPAFTLAGAPPIDSASLDARQNEKNAFQVLSYQRSLEHQLDFHVSVFHRYTDVAYRPDPVGDLVFNGIAANILRKNEAAGFQGDMSYHLGDKHIVRAGAFASRERFAVNNSAAA